MPQQQSATSSSTEKSIDIIDYLAINRARWDERAPHVCLTLSCPVMSYHSFVSQQLQPQSPFFVRPLVVQPSQPPLTCKITTNNHAPRTARHVPRLPRRPPDRRAVSTISHSRFRPSASAVSLWQESRAPPMPHRHRHALARAPRSRARRRPRSQPRESRRSAQSSVQSCRRRESGVRRRRRVRCAGAVGRRPVGCSLHRYRGVRLVA
jgi:hypothetical protein